MVNLISKISKGSKMDQIYLPKVRPPGFGVGETVEILPTQRKKVPFYSYHVSKLEPLKSIIIDEILAYFEHAENVFITGSFLEEGFQFNDIDVLVISETGHEKSWSDYFRWKLGLPVHIISVERKSLRHGLQQDPLFQMMMSKYIAGKREIFKFKNAFNYKLLDLHVHKSKTLIDNFEILTGKEKYNLARNLIAIALFLKEKKLDRPLVEREMESLFGKRILEELKENTVDKRMFIPKFARAYEGTFQKILKGIQYEPQSK